ncbi:hypothetical protein GT347_20195 [Xylophilus rhododendri]|uniref:Uncharacterized protein n=1 Tax=Xylophilus rhododendri TaxID=2697032 RepID=A0A857JBK9_9BURK|nr:hypothetical protein [Xylophilus rhododendri]QHJ00096.1 hypothetical protein GT347_20195 [Xylophilus rhododendri]
MLQILECNGNGEPTMVEGPIHARSWGANPLKERDETIAVLDAWGDLKPRAREWPRPHRGRWVAGALAIAAGAVGTSVAFPGVVMALFGS